MTRRYSGSRDAGNAAPVRRGGGAPIPNRLGYLGRAGEKAQGWQVSTPGIETLNAAARGERDALAEVARAIQRFAVPYCRARLRGDCGFRAADTVATQVCLDVLAGLFRNGAGSLPFLEVVYPATASRVDEAIRGPHAPGPPRSRPLMQSLCGLERETLLLRVVVGLTSQQTGHALGLSAPEVQRYAHRALNRLRKEMT
ncbi:hypothetical protein LTT66_12420 [Nocardia gipuzkoensis]|uniref:sigma factor-like helix-turn-helix DNA-binding protein n=1 Tax=Nocardia gipuzkoensis TaxID=2749991 RepID=UPI001E4C72DF|nr:sigma factor-like helix-turn-helix DNA-binding protein [Nocardia gipuzkoensis]UGT70900.1 hypothetical protein LTT66_12420 [Nocardia gipuzkoensis]